MKILDQFTKSDTGLDYQITYAVCLLEVQPEHYVVVSTEKYSGPRFNQDFIDTSEYSLTNWNDAFAQFNKLKKGAYK